MADLKISQLTSAATPLAGTEVLPIVQSSTTKKVATDDLTVKNIRSNATTGILQIAGPGASATRTMTTPDANFTAARTDAAQSFTGVQSFVSPIALPTQQALAASATINAATYLVTMYGLSGTATLTLPASPTIGQIIRIRSQSNEAVISASNNITSLASGEVTNAILSATAGKWADLWWDGSYWNIIAAN